MWIKYAHFHLRAYMYNVTMYYKNQRKSMIIYQQDNQWVFDKGWVLWTFLGYTIFSQCKLSSVAPHPLLRVPPPPPEPYTNSTTRTIDIQCVPY